MRKKTKITFLFDKNNAWFEKYFNIKDFRKKKKYRFKINKKYKNIKNQDIVFIINYTKILPENFLKKNRLNLVVHASDLPKDRGFAPVTYQILKNKKKIHVCLIEAKKRVDSGDIFIKKNFTLNGSEIYEEIREKTAINMIRLIKIFLNKYPRLNKKKQVGKATYNRKRNPKDSMINIQKSIKSQFNLMRVCDNENFPLFFYHKNNRYILKIFKDD